MMKTCLYGNHARRQNQPATLGQVGPVLPVPDNSILAGHRTRRSRPDGPAAICRRCAVVLPTHDKENQTARLALACCGTCRIPGASKAVGNTARLTGFRNTRRGDCAKVAATGPRNNLRQPLRVNGKSRAPARLQIRGLRHRDVTRLPGDSVEIKQRCAGLQRASERAMDLPEPELPRMTMRI